MSHMYYYKKDFDVNSAVLIEMLKLSEIRPKFDSLHVSYDKDNGVMGIVEVYTTDVLQIQDEDKLINVINEYTLNCEMQLRYNLEKTLINPAMSYGREIVAKFGTNNVYRQKTDAQIQAISSDFQPLIIDLLTGSLKQAYYKVSAMTPDSNISQEELDEFKQRIGWFLGL